MSISEKISQVQLGLVAPKGQRNDFGKYNYRTCENIMEALKPHLAKTGLSVIVSDKMVEVGGRVYVRAKATVSDGESKVKATAYARECETKKGMDEAQITGAASSYARKYCLSGLFLIDGNADPDATNKHDFGSNNAVMKGDGGNPSPEGTSAASGEASEGTTASSGVATPPDGAGEVDVPLGEWREEKLGFGKHKGQTLGEIHAKNPGYVEWLMGQLNDEDSNIAKNHGDALLAASKELQPNKHTISKTDDWNL